MVAMVIVALKMMRMVVVGHVIVDIVTSAAAAGKVLV